MAEKKNNSNLKKIKFNFFQEDFNETDDIVTSQPGPKQATSNMPAFAMPPPSTATNPFASETSNLNQGGTRTYTPGERY